MEYFNVCKEIWNRWVPQRGHAQVLQGELLRQIERLRYEAQHNENRNWNDDFLYYCDFSAPPCGRRTASPRRSVRR